jgi:hypothetical protein
MQIHESIVLSSEIQNPVGRAYVFNQGTFVLERVSLAQMVELMIEVLVNLASGTVLDEETA